MTTVETALLDAFPGAAWVAEGGQQSATMQQQTRRPKGGTKAVLPPVDPLRKERLGLLAAARARGCSNPVRLTGSLNVRDSHTGDVIHRWSSAADEPSGVAYVPCKTRRAAKCASCAALYQGDAYRLIAEGLRGGEFMDVSISEHSALFVTFTAPTFGAVHSQRRTKGGQIQACHPRGSKTCPHGAGLTCNKNHSDNDPLLGQAIMPCCYDYRGSVVWNYGTGDLWRETRKNIDRKLAGLLGVTPTKMKATLCRTQFIRVAEFQARGLVHLHVLVRLDGPDGARASIDPVILKQAIESAGHSTTVKGADGERIGWGEQIDAREVGVRLGREKIAGYFAKYATKGSDAKGMLNSRIQRENQIDRLPVTDHQRRMIRAAWELGQEQEELTADLWAHQFGFGGHFMTKSRASELKDGTTWVGWSTTFKELRSRRSEHNAEVSRLTWQAKAPDAVLVIISEWQFAGIGYESAEEAERAARIRADRHLQTAPEQGQEIAA